VIAAITGLFIAIYFFSPGRTNILLLGIDETPPDSDIGRSDTNILITILPPGPYVGMLSIPRDLWVNIPGVGENRINTAHFFAEAAQQRAGPAAAMRTVRDNFGVDVDHYMRIKFNGFKQVFEAMGGLDLVLSEPMAGYDVGTHQLTARKALAFARNRSSSDDFARMRQGQVVLKSAMKQILSPANWSRIPAVTVAIFQAIDSDIPIWLWPRLGFTMLRVGPGGIDNRTIDRELVIPTTTDQGANILLPRWDMIRPIIFEMFNQ
jgi:LCP family protein required for cell wall assembly